MTRFLLLGYAIAACALSFHVGASTTFFPEGVLYENAYVNYWLDYGVSDNTYIENLISKAESKI